MDQIRKFGAWLWGSLGNIVWIGGLFTAFALPAWAVKVTGVFATYAPLSWVVSGFVGMAIGSATFALVAWAKGRLVRTRYDARLLSQGGEIDPLANTFERKRIFLNEFILPSKPLIEGKTFIDCEIIGPATVILARGNTVNEHRLPVCDAYVMSAKANPDNGYVFNNCAFRGCSLVRVSLMFSLEEYEKAKDVDWLNWVSIRPDRLDEASRPPLIDGQHSGQKLLPSPDKRKWPWQK